MWQKIKCFFGRHILECYLRSPEEQNRCCVYCTQCKFITHITVLNDDTKEKYLITKKEFVKDVNGKTKYIEEVNGEQWEITIHGRRRIK